MSSSRFAVGFLVGAAVSCTVFWWWSYGKLQADASQITSGAEAVQHGDFKGRLPPISVDVASGGGGTSSDFLSGIVKALWSHVNAFLSASIRESVEPLFAQTLPKPFSTLRFTKLSFGSNPIRFENVVIHKEETTSTVDPSLPSACVVKMDLDVIWEAQCEIELQANIVGTLGLRKFTLAGRLALLLHPMDQSPIVSAVQCSFINPPTISLDFTGLAQVADLRIVKKRILSTLQDSLASMMVLPQRMLIKMDPATSFLDLYAPPRGVLRLTLLRGQGFEVQRSRFGQQDIVDVYCVVSLGNKTWTSSTIDNHLEPEWNETSDFLWHELDQEILLNIWDRDQGTLDADDHLGVAKIALRQALESPDRTVSVQVYNNWKELKATGISVTIAVENLALTENLSSLHTFSRNYLCGVLEVLVLGAHDLPVAKADATSCVKVQCGKREFVTGTVADGPGIDGLNPVYDCYFVIPIEHPKEFCDVVFALCTAQQQVLGSCSVTRDALEQISDRKLIATLPVGDKRATLEICVCLRGIERSTEGTRPLCSLAKMPSSSPTKTGKSVRTRALPASARAASAPSRRPAIGTVRLTAVRGYGFKVQRRRFRKADIPDVYCKIHCGEPSNVWRTTTVRDSVNPDWNQSQTFPLYDAHDVVVIDVFDEDSAKVDSDDHIGSGRVTLSTLLSDSVTRPLDVPIKREGKGTVAFVALKAERLPGM